MDKKLDSYSEQVSQITSDTSLLNNPTVLAILPSIGLGGGIERYSNWLLDVLEKNGCSIVKVPLLKTGENPTLKNKFRFIFRLVKISYEFKYNGNCVAIVFHPSLAFLTSIIFKITRINLIKKYFLFYGEDIWNLKAFLSWHFRKSRGDKFTISSFSSGALSKIGRAQIITPGISEEWFKTLVDASKQYNKDRSTDGIKLLSVFRLDSATSKGLVEIIEATKVAREQANCRLIVAGSGSLPHDLFEMINKLDWISVEPNIDDKSLAKLYADADIFILATRTTSIKPTSGEGFGLVLIEAQITGTAVIAPAFGGSDDAFSNGITGLKPIDESSDALAKVLIELISNETFRKLCSENARNWSTVKFNPESASRHVCDVLHINTRTTGDKYLNLTLKNSG